jgi:hypothetical protein
MKETIQEQLKKEIEKMAREPRMGERWDFASKRAARLARILRDLEVAEAARKVSETVACGSISVRPKSRIFNEITHCFRRGKW